MFLFSFSRGSYFPIIFFREDEQQAGCVGPDRTNVVGDKNAGRDGGGTGTCHVIFVLYSIRFFSSFFFFSNCLQHDNRWDGAATRGGRGWQAGDNGEVEGRTEEGSGGGQGS